MLENMKIGQSKVVSHYDPKLGKAACQFAEAYNNTQAWEHGGSVFVDSLKYPKVFLQAMEKEFGLKGKVLHENKDHDIGVGNEGSGLPFGGRKTMCNVVEFPLHTADEHLAAEGIKKYHY
jgi:hypothetical protein